MGNAGAENHAEHEDGGVTVTFAGEEELTTRAAAGQGKGQTGQSHSCEIPNTESMGDGLILEARMELSQDQISYKGGDDEGDQSRKEMNLPEEQEITEGAHSTKAAPLGDKPDRKTRGKRYQ